MTLLPRSAVERLGVVPLEGQQVEVEGFDGSRSFAPVVELDLIFLSRAYRGRYALIDDETGIMGRDILNHVTLLLHGPAAGVVGAFAGLSQCKQQPSSPLGTKFMPSEMFDLAGRVALVTGGSKGLGKAMARAFAEHEADVIITSRHENELQSALGEILSGTGQKGAYFVADMTNRADVARLGKAAVEKYGRVDILVNNAGSNVPEACDEITDENWDRIVELNLNSCMAMTRAVVPGMKARQWGRIIYISSVMGLASKAGRNSYSATKAALIGLARANALDLGEHGITANCIAPGPFLTDLPMSVLSDEEKRAFASQTAMNRWADPKELTGAALLLGSDAGSYITGTTIVVDGGMLVKLS